MPLRWRFDDVERLVVATAEGFVLPEEMLALLAQIDARGARPWRKIFDVTELKSMFPDERVLDLAKLIRFRNAETTIGPIAIVATDATILRQAALFVGSGAIDKPIRVFRALHEAHSWMDSLGDA
jgi:hypothetical protein